MNVFSKFSFYFIFLFSFNMYTAEKQSSFPFDFFRNAIGGEASALSALAKENGIKGSLGIAMLSLWMFSQVQKNNPEFLSNIYRLTKLPFVFAKKHSELILYGGESLSYNDIVSVSNRVKSLMLPFTKQTTISDLQKERRYKSIVNSEENSIDERWTIDNNHIKEQLKFIATSLSKSLPYYELKVESKSIITKSLNSLRSATTLSAKKNLEVSFYIKQLIKYLTEIVDYCNKINSHGDIDKDYLKSAFSACCSTFEHLAILIDESIAAPRGVLQFKSQNNTQYQNNYSDGYSGLNQQYN